MTTPQAPVTPNPEPPSALLVMCVECGAGFELRLPLDLRTLSRALAEKGAYPSVLTPPAQDVPMLIGALCAACAQKVYPADVFKKIEEGRQQLLQAPQAPR